MRSKRTGAATRESLPRDRTGGLAVTVAVSVVILLLVTVAVPAAVLVTLALDVTVALAVTVSVAVLLLVAVAVPVAVLVTLALDVTVALAVTAVTVAVPTCVQKGLALPCASHSREIALAGSRRLRFTPVRKRQSFECMLLSL